MEKSESHSSKRSNKRKLSDLPRTPFYGALRRLCDEHEREISALQYKITDLEKQSENSLGGDLEIKAPTEPRTLLEPDPPSETLTQLMICDDSSAVGANAASLDLTVNSTEMVKADAPDTQEVKYDSTSSDDVVAGGQSTQSKDRTSTFSAESVPGVVEELNSVSPPDPVVVSLQVVQASAESPSDASSSSPNGRLPGEIGGDSNRALLQPPTASRKGPPSCDTNGEANGKVRSRENSVCSGVSAISASSAASAVSKTSAASAPPRASFNTDMRETRGSVATFEEGRDANTSRLSARQDSGSLGGRQDRSISILSGVSEMWGPNTETGKDCEKIRSFMTAMGEESQEPEQLKKTSIMKKSKTVGGSILRVSSQFDEGAEKFNSSDRRVSWLHGHTPDEEAKEEKKTNRSKFKVLDIWHQEDAGNVEDKKAATKTHGVTRLSGAMMAIQKTFQTMGLTGERSNRGTIDSENIVNSGDPCEAQKMLIEYHSRINSKGALMERYVTNPNSGVHFFWDLFSMLIIAYDIITVPLTLFSSMTIVTAMCTVIFWSVSIVRSFFTGFLSKGDVVMNVPDIAHHYIRTWLFPDLLITAMEWAQIILHYSLHDDDLLRTFKIFRILQLMRGFKAVRIIKAIEERITQERYSVAFTLVKFFTCILMVNHLIACLWYGIGDAHRGNGPNWLEAYIEEDSESLGYLYATSFHWALTQFTPASIEVQPRNSMERVFAIIVLLFALVTVSSFISGITGAVMELQNLAATKSKQFWLLRRYLSESSVPTELALRVQHYCDFSWQLREHRLLEEHVEVLGLLSATLRVQLNTAIFEPRISVHPLFVLISKMASFIMQKICNTAVMRTMFIHGDTLFGTHVKMSKMFVICSGDWEYQLEETGKQEQVPSGVWVCEPALWTEWSTHGSLVALTDCEIVSIDTAAFGEAVKMADEILCEAVSYARGFIQGLNRLDKSKLTDLFYSNLIEGLWFRLLNDWNVRQRPTLVNGIEVGKDFGARSSTTSIASNVLLNVSGKLNIVEE